jgi:hypothetical protein
LRVSTRVAHARLARGLTGAAGQWGVGVAAGGFEAGSSGLVDGTGPLPLGEGETVLEVFGLVGWSDAPDVGRGRTVLRAGALAVGDGDGREVGGPGETLGETGGAIGRGFAGSPPPGHRNNATVTRTAAVTTAASAGNAHRHRTRRSMTRAARPASWNPRTVPGAAVTWSAAAR